MKANRFILIFLFLALLYFPLLNNWLHFIMKSYDGIIPVMPTLDIMHPEGYPKKFENYFDDVLEIKPWLVGVNSKFKIRLLKVSPVPEKVQIGSEGWLYMGGKTMDEYRGTNLFTQTQLESLKEKLELRAIYCKEKYNASFYFFIAPLKHTIYPEYLPRSAKKIGTSTRYDQVMDILKGDPKIMTADLRNKLIEKKSGHILFYKTDNHWNDIGGYIAYQEIAAILRKQLPDFPHIDSSAFRLDSNQILTGGESEMMNAGDMFSEKRFDYYPTEKCRQRLMPKRGYQSPIGFPFPNDYEIQMQTGDSTKPNAVIIRDSFTDALLPFLAESFNRSTFIFDAWEYNKNYSILDIEKPDLVIYIVLESNLNSILDYN